MHFREKKQTVTYVRLLLDIVESTLYLNKPRWTKLKEAAWCWQREDTSPPDTINQQTNVAASAVTGLYNSLLNLALDHIIPDLMYRVMREHWPLWAQKVG